MPLRELIHTREQQTLGRSQGGLRPLDSLWGGMGERQEGDSGGSRESQNTST